MIRSKQALSNFNYWLAIVGYDIHDRSAIARVYSFYLVAFFSAWILAAMFWVSDLIANALSPFLASQGIAFTDIVPTMGMLLFILWSLYSIHKATNRSPLVFSEVDAHLLCQTPVDRRFITMVWLFGEWLSKVLLVSAIASTVGFALLELDISNGIRVMSIGHLTVAALKPLGIIIPLHLGLFALVWAIGVYRLQRDAKRIKVMRLLRFFSVILATTLIVLMLGNIIVPTFFADFHPLLSFLTLPIHTAFFEGAWGQVLTVTIGLMIISLSVLRQISDKLNLSRASQETHHFQAQQVAFSIGDFESIDEMKDCERLGSLHVPSKIPSLPGAWILTWKDIVQSLRTVTISRLWSWIIIPLYTFPLIVAGAIFKDSSSLIFFILFWTLHVGQLTSARFRKDLGKWWYVHSLPLSARRIILHDVVRPVFATIVITWIALWASSILGISINPILVFSVPFVVVVISFSFVFDILRQANVSMLLLGRSPFNGFIGLILAIFFIIIPIAIIYMVEYLALSLVVSMLAIGLAEFSLAFLLLLLCERQFKRIG